VDLRARSLRKRRRPSPRRRHRVSALLLPRINTPGESKKSEAGPHYVLVICLSLGSIYSYNVSAWLRVCVAFCAAEAEANTAANRWRQSDGRCVRCECPEERRPCWGA
jgi:hypothetical protein